MQIVIDVNEDTDPNVVGEYLREQFFVGEGLGCYSNFEINPRAPRCHASVVRRILSNVDHWDKEIETYFNPVGYVMLVQSELISMCYYWDGDGVLVFQLEHEGLSLINTDCKKTHNWEWYDNS